MTTQVFFSNITPTAPFQFSLGTNAPRLRDGTGVGWFPGYLDTVRGSGVVAQTTSTVAGTTLGVEVATSGIPFSYVTPPLNADVTISGTITLNLWASESNMSANVAINAIIERIDSTGAIVSTIAQTARTTELAVTTSSVNNFTVTPTSTAMLKGDRIRVRVYGDDAGTMASGFTFDFSYSGTTGAADGDSYVTFTETFGFLTTDPTTTTVYPTATTLPTVDDPLASVEQEMWTARGALAQTASATLTTGWVAPQLVSPVWFTKPLTAFTLSGPVLVNARCLASTTNKHAAVRGELAITAGDGSSVTVWAATSFPTQVTGTEAAYVFYIAGDDVAISDGQRLRFRTYADDESTTPMVTTGTFDVKYAGTSGGASGDTFLTFGQTLTEYVTATGIPDLIMAPRIAV